MNNEKTETKPELCEADEKFLDLLQKELPNIPRNKLADRLLMAKQVFVHLEGKKREEEKTAELIRLFVNGTLRISDGTPTLGYVASVLKVEEADAKKNGKPIPSNVTCTITFGDDCFKVVCSRSNKDEAK